MARVTLVRAPKIAFDPSILFVAVALLALIFAVRYVPGASSGGGLLVTESTTKRLGEMPPGQVQTASFVLKNLGDRPVKLIGAKASCSCTAVDGVPVTVAPSGSREVTFRVATPSQPGPVDGEVTLYTNNPEQVEIRLRYAGEVVDPTAPGR